MTNTLTTDERENLPSASSLQRVVYCPGSWNAEQSAERIDTSSTVSKFGDDVHAAIAAEDLAELGIKESDVADRLMRMEKAAIEQWKIDFGVEKIVVVREKRMWLKSGNEKVASGKPDLFIHTTENPVFLCIDFKSGFKDAPVSSRNWQLKFFVAWAWQSLVMAGVSSKGCKIRVAIAQHRLGERFDATDYDHDDMRQAYNEVMFFLRRAKNPDAERIPSAECQYCKAKAQCPEYSLYSMMPMLRAKMAVDVPKKAEVIAKVSLLPLDALAYIESRRTIAVNLFEAVKERLKGLPADQLKDLGYELKPSGSTRTVPDLVALWAILCKNDLCTPEEFTRMCDISIGTLEEKLVPRLKLMHELETSKEAEDMLKKLLEPVVAMEPKAPTLKVLKSP
jgi:hypothetical protein